MTKSKVINWLKGNQNTVVGLVFFVLVISVVASWFVFFPPKQERVTDNINEIVKETFNNSSVSSIDIISKKNQVAVMDVFAKSLVSQIAGGELQVLDYSNRFDKGSDSGNFSTSEWMDLYQSKAVITSSIDYFGEFLQQESTIQNLLDQGVVVVDLAREMKLLPYQESDLPAISDIKKDYKYETGYWLNLQNAKQSARIVNSILSSIDPVNSTKYNENWQVLDFELNQVYKLYNNQLENCKQNVFLIGDSLAYLLSGYDIDYSFVRHSDIANLTSFETSLIKERIDTYEPRSIFITQKIDPLAKSLLASDLDKTSLIYIDPYIRPPQMQNYQEIMKKNLIQIASSLKCS